MIPDDSEIPEIPDGIGSAISEVEAQKIRDRVKRELAEEIAFWRGALSTPIGRRVLWGLLDQFHAFTERFALGPTGMPSELATFVHAGEQKCGMYLFLKWQRYAPELTLLMQQENDPSFAPARQPKRNSTAKAV